MTEVNTTEDATLTPDLDPAGWLDDDEYARHRNLGLQRVAWRHREPHPDTRPCPAWCQCADDPGDHSIKTTSMPLLANHVSEVIETLASCYPGQDVEDEGGAVFLASVIESRLTRRGQDGTRLRLTLRPRGGELRNMTLSLDDAADLVTAMSYLLAQADASDLVEQGDELHNAFQLGRDHQRHIAMDAFAEAGHPAGCECGDVLDKVFDDAVS